MDGWKDEKKEPFSKRSVSSRLYISVIFVAKNVLNVSLGLFICFKTTPFISYENAPVRFFFSSGQVLVLQQKDFAVS